MDTESKATDEVLEVEAERLPLEGEAWEESPATKERLRALSPVVAGIIIDLIDAGTFGPVGIKFGLPVGGLAGYWLAGEMGFRGKRRLQIAVAAGVYCMLPMTSVLPLGTILGALARYRSVGGAARG